MIRVQAEPFDAAAELGRFTDALATSGAVVSFTGVVRARSDGSEVCTLELEHYPAFTAKVIADIEAEARRRFPLEDCLIIHRFGKLAPGEPIVFVATAAEHRRAAFEAADYLMDRLKTEAPFWKRERRGNGAAWIEPREADLRDRARWDEKVS